MNHTLAPALQGVPRTELEIGREGEVKGREAVALADMQPADHALALTLNV